MSDNILPGRQASFRGARFHFQSSTDSGGNRIVTHIYPNRDQHANEDLGNLPDIFDVAGYITTPNIEVKELALKEAFSADGVATFFHPMLRTNIECQAVSWSFTPDKNSISRRNFTVSIVTEGEKPSPLATLNAKPKVIGSLAARKNVILEFFRNTLNTANTASVTVQSAIDDVTSAIQQTRAAIFSNFVAGVVLVAGPLDSAQGLAKEIVTSTDLTPLFDIVDGVFDGFSVKKPVASLGFNSTVTLSVSNDLKRELAMVQMSEVSLTPTISKSQQGLTRSANTAAIQSAFRQYALLKLAESIVQTNYSDSEQAHAARVDFTSRSIAQQQRLSLLDNSTDSYASIAELSSLVGQQLSTLADKLKPISTTNTGSPRSSLSLAWDLYQDPSRANDLINRNAVDNGSFMPPTVRHLTQ
ncbi:MAG: prophage DNA circulation protein [Arenicella sp.]|jgi:prophage DNA circulation protein